MKPYPHYPSRSIINLDGVWDFKFTGDCEFASLQMKDLRFDDIMSVPGAFDCSPAYYCKRGVALYRTTFSLEQACSDALLKLGGIGLQGRFWLDSKEIGTVTLPYSGVSLRLGALATGKHELVAAIDNRFNKGQVPLFLPFYDFYAFGGFYRSVELHLFQENWHIDRVQVKTLDYTTGRVQLNLKLSGNTPNAMHVKLRFDTEDCFREVKICAPDYSIDEFVPAFKLWSPETPALHKLELKTGSEYIVESFGIREITTVGNGILLNGKQIYLKGFNRHESHPQFGPASPEQLMIEDLQNLKRLNCNFVRGCHYPQDQRFLNLCDRLGFLVWEESLGWGNTSEQLSDPLFMDQQEEQSRLMVKNSFNHPSIIIWGFMNEFHSETEEGKTLCRRLVNAIKQEDDSRIVTFACNHTRDDICYDLVDIISINTYPGWIDTDGDNDPMKEIKPDLEDIIAYFRTKAGNKPIIVSEMGTCGVYGQHDQAGAQWTEEFQVEYLDEVISSVFSLDELCGITLWQMNDTKSYLRKGANIRCKPFALNMAGVFDQYRRSKLAAALVKNMFGKQN